MYNKRKYEMIIMSTAYVENGILVKWRYDRLDKNHIDAILNNKYKTSEVLTEKDIEHIKKLSNVVIIEDGIEIIYNPSLTFSQMIKNYEMRI